MSVGKATLTRHEALFLSSNFHNQRAAITQTS